MLDTFEILTTSGVVLWSRSFTPVSSDLINHFINDVFIEEKGSSTAARESQSAATNPPYKSDQQTLKWTFVKELGIIFVVGFPIITTLGPPGFLLTLLCQAVYRSLLHLSWIDKLVDNIKTLFVDLYGDQLTKPHTTLVECHKFDEYFDQQLRQLEQLSGGESRATTAAAQLLPLEEETLSGNLGDEPPPLPTGLTHRHRAAAAAAAAHRSNNGNDETSTDNTPIATPNTSRPSTPGAVASAASHLLTGKAGPPAKLSRRARRVQMAGGSAPASSGDEAPRPRAGKGAKTAKKGRKWDADGLADEDDDVVLDYSAARTSDSEAEAAAHASGVERVDASTWGTKTAQGRFVLKDLDDEVNDILAAAEARQASSKAEKAAAAAKTGGLVGSSLSTISGLFKNVVGGKTLTKEDLATAMKGMEDHLLKKNVALEAAVRLCEGVSKELEGVKMGSFESQFLLSPYPCRVSLFDNPFSTSTKSCSSRLDKS